MDCSLENVMTVSFLCAGDHYYKRKDDLPAEEQMISAVPDIKAITVEAEDQFFVLACDGIW